MRQQAREHEHYVAYVARTTVPEMRSRSLPKILPTRFSEVAALLEALL